MSELKYKPLETYNEVPLIADLQNVLLAVVALSAAIHELNSKIEFLAKESSIVIPPSNNFGG